MVFPEESYNGTSPTLLSMDLAEITDFHKTLKDSYNNNLLHLAGKLAPPQKLNLVSGAALQMQRELQWFKEVEAFVHPKYKTEKNSFEQTPEMLFLKEHKKLVRDGEEWMKKTADSYTVTAGLITTIVFAAAITVPGGNNGETGHPIYAKELSCSRRNLALHIHHIVATILVHPYCSLCRTRFSLHVTLKANNGSRDFVSVHDLDDDSIRCIIVSFVWAGEGMDSDSDSCVVVFTYYLFRYVTISSSCRTDIVYVWSRTFR